MADHVEDAMVDDLEDREGGVVYRLYATLHAPLSVTSDSDRKNDNGDDMRQLMYQYICDQERSDLPMMTFSISYELIGRPLIINAKTKIGVVYTLAAYIDKCDINTECAVTFHNFSKELGQSDLGEYLQQVVKEMECSIMVEEPNNPISFPFEPIIKSATKTS